MSARHPWRRATCPECRKQVMSYVPEPPAHQPRRYVFKMHNRAGSLEFVLGRDPCPGVQTRVPDDAFCDGEPNIDAPPPEPPAKAVVLVVREGIDADLVARLVGATLTLNGFRHDEPAVIDWPIRSRR